MNKRIPAILLLTLAICLLLSTALAKETAPLVGNAIGESVSERGEKIRNVGFGQSRGGVGISSKWLRQASVKQYSLNMGLYTPDGDPILFREKLNWTGEREMCLTLQAKSWDIEPMLQLDDRAMEILEAYGITSIRLVDRELYTRVTYTLEDIRLLRKVFGVQPGESISLRGNGNPVTAVGTDGVRRLLSAN